jgi:hypothetical protein
MRRSTERGRRERRFSPAQAVAWFQKKEVASMKGFLTKLDVHFISSLPVMPGTAYMAWVDSKPVQMVWGVD